MLMWYDVADPLCADDHLAASEQWRQMRHNFSITNVRIVNGRKFNF